MADGDATSSGRVLVVGSLNVDTTSYVERFPDPGETVVSHGLHVALGGKGANQAIAAHLAGARVDLVARVGDDASGRTAISALDRFGLALDGVESVDHEPTGIAQIVVADSGENTIVVTSGANRALDADIVDALGARIAAASVVLTQGELARATIDRLAMACRGAGVRFVLNLAPPVDVDRATLAAADPLIVNEHEARDLGIGAGLDETTSRRTDWADAARAAVGSIARSVVVTLGGLGAVTADASGSAAIAAPNVEVVDTTGAGDCFTGTLAAFLAEGRPLAEAARIAVAAGALAVQSRGTVDSYAPREAVLALAERMEAR